MSTQADDNRSEQRRMQDEAIASEARMPAPDLPVGAVPKPLEAHLPKHRRPVALAGVVENGLIRPIDASVHLPEHSRVIIVTSE